MKVISKDQISILTRRKEFLDDRLKRLGSYNGSSYDKCESEALRIAVGYMDFIYKHPSIQRRIKEQMSLEEVYELSKELEEI